MLIHIGLIFFRILFPFSSANSVIFRISVWLLRPSKFFCITFFVVL